MLVSSAGGHAFTSAYDFGPWPLLAGVADLQPRVLEVGNCFIMRYIGHNRKRAPGCPASKERGASIPCSHNRPCLHVNTARLHRMRHSCTCSDEYPCKWHAGAARHPGADAEWLCAGRAPGASGGRGSAADSRSWRLSLLRPRCRSCCLFMCTCMQHAIRLRFPLCPFQPFAVSAPVRKPRCTIAGMRQPAPVYIGISHF